MSPPPSEGCSPPWSRTIRTARSRTSVFVVLLVMAPSSQELEPPANPGRFITCYLGMLEQIQNSYTKAITWRTNSLGLSKLKLADGGSHPTVPTKSNI